MKKFNSRLNEVYSNILGEAPNGQGIPQDGGPVNPPSQDGAAPAQQGAPSPAPAPEAPPPPPLTSEGKMFLVQLALKALAVDPNTISEQDKALFETNVTTANADQVADRIRQIVEGL